MNEEGIESQVQIQYRFDQYLMFLIQDITKKPSAEIMNLFHELATTICKISFEKRRKDSRWMRKKIVDFFPGTSIPFQMKADGHKRWRPYTQAEGPLIYDFEVHVQFPEECMYMKEEELQNISVAIMENALLDAGHKIEVPEFKRPEIKSNKMFTETMNTFMGRPQPEKKKRTRKKKEESDGVSK